MVVEKMGISISLLTYWSYISFICCFLLKWVYPCVFCWTMMIVSFDMIANYDVASEEHVTRGWCGLSGRLRGEIRSFVIYLCFVLVGTKLGFIFLHGFMLYLFPKLDPWILFGNLFMMFDNVVSWGACTFMFYNSRTFYKWSLYDTFVFMIKKKVTCIFIN